MGTNSGFDGGRVGGPQGAQVHLVRGSLLKCLLPSEHGKQAAAARYTTRAEREQAAECLSGQGAGIQILTEASSTSRIETT